MPSRFYYPPPHSHYREYSPQPYQQIPVHWSYHCHYYYPPPCQNIASNRTNGAWNQTSDYFTPPPSHYSDSTMATPDADEMEQFQRLSDQYQANLPVRPLTIPIVLTLNRHLGPSGWRQKEFIRAGKRICSSRYHLCAQNNCMYPLFTISAGC